MSPTKGIVFRLCAVLCFVVMFSLIKATADSVPAGQAVFYRSLFALPIIVAWLFLRAELRNGLKVKSRIGHFWRSLFGTCAMSLNFAALGYLPLPDVTAIGYLAPSLTIVFAALFLKERLRLFRTVTIGIGFLGVLVVIEPRVSLFSPDHMEEVFLIGVALVLTGAVLVSLLKFKCAVWCNMNTRQPLRFILRRHQPFCLFLLICLDGFHFQSCNFCVLQPLV